MTSDATPAKAFDRRSFLRTLGAAGAVAAGGTLLAREDVFAATIERGPTLLRQRAITGAPAPEQLHVQFGADAAHEVAVSWATPEAVVRPRLRLGRPGKGFGDTIDAVEKMYTERLSGQNVFTYHVPLNDLKPDTEYTYQVFHRGSTPVTGRFRTGPRSHSRFRFTSFGDQAVPIAVGTGINPHTPNAGYIVDAVEAADPLFHLMNGDLCYANVADDPVGVWSAFYNNNQRSAANRPWMPCAGNHENEVGNGPDGYLAYQTRHWLPDNDQPDVWQGNWYAFTVGNVRVVSINNDDVCYQDGGFSTYRRDHIKNYSTAHLDPYIRGYSHGAQKAWLQRTLADARDDSAIDWVIVCMHQVAMSSAHFNGADLGIRQEFASLFDRYVDLVVCGHEHHFERTFPVRGALPGALLTPAAQDNDTREIDTSKGWVQMIIGGGGHSTPTPPSAFDAPHDGVVITGVGSGSPASQRPAITTTESGEWSAYRDLATPYGFAAFDVDPHASSDTTTITVTHLGAAAGSRDYQPLDRCVLKRPRGRRDDRSS